MRPPGLSGGLVCAGDLSADNAATVLLFDVIAATTAKKEFIEDAFGRKARGSHRGS